MLSAEISTIYRCCERTRKVHHLLYAPTFEAADRITSELSKIGNLASDGRPILGLDSRDLLEITLGGWPGCCLVPAHVWTPWFAVLGSKSGFDLVAECYGDLADQVFAIETGLSSDPSMNWQCPALDAYRLVSNSDAHSPPMLGREATAFDVSLDYFAMAHALRTGDGSRARSSSSLRKASAIWTVTGNAACALIRLRATSTTACTARSGTVSAHAGARCRCLTAAIWQSPMLDGIARATLMVSVTIAAYLPGFGDDVGRC